MTDHILLAAVFLAQSWFLRTVATTFAENLREAIALFLSAASIFLLGASLNQAFYAMFGM